MLPFKGQGLRLFCSFTGLALVEVVEEEHSVVFFQIPLWMALEGIAAPSVEGIASTWAECSVSVYIRECFQLDRIFLTVGEFRHAVSF